jgi:hypothetical protein
MAEIDGDERWTVRGVPKRYRDRAGEAATRRKLTLGAYLCEAIDLAVRQKREPIVADKRADIVAPVIEPLAAGYLGLVERAVTAAVALAGVPDVPTTFRRRANRLLREALPPAARRMPRIEGASQNEKTAPETGAAPPEPSAPTGAIERPACRRGSCRTPRRRP